MAKVINGNGVVNKNAVLKKNIATKIAQARFQFYFKPHLVSHYDSMMNEVVYGLYHHIWGVEEKEIITEDKLIPKTWWDHFKETHLPLWLLHRYPAKHKTIEVKVTRYRVCPYIIEKANEHCEKTQNCVGVIQCDL